MSGTPLAPLLRSLLAALATTAAGHAQDFVACAEAMPARGDEVALGNGATLLLHRDGIACHDASGVRPVPSTSPTGRVHELTLLPWGTVFAACERGLFALDAEHVVLDRADLRDGAPAGEVLSVAADATGRAFWCNARQLGVVDTRLRFGRRFTPADGVPAAALQRVAFAGDGRLLVATEGGTFAYTPDTGPPPDGRGTGGVPATLLASPAGEVTLPVAAVGRGGATLRVRRRHHHMVEPLDGNVVRGLRPGRHALEAYAFDRDLRCRLVATFAVEVPLPPRFAPRNLLLAAGLALAAVFAASWHRQRQGPPVRRAGAAALRTGVLAVVALQLLAAVFGYGRSWPFVGFSMYTATWHEGDVVFRPRIIGVRADGARVLLHEQRIGLHQDGYWQMLAEVAFGDVAHRRDLFARIAGCRGPCDPPFVSFRLADGRIRLTPAGPVDVAPTVLVAWGPP